MTIDEICSAARRHTDTTVKAAPGEHRNAYSHRWNTAYFAEVDRLRAALGCWYQGVPWPKPPGWGLAPVPFEGGGL